MIALLAAAWAAPACTAVDPVADHLQVAWISPDRESVRLHDEIVVVTTRALLELSEARGRDPVAVLHGLGFRSTAGDWKVTIFDVDRAELCRPMEGDGAEAGLLRCDGVRAPSRMRPRSWTGCGYVLDADSSTRTLDVFGVEWADAADTGFCVLPLTRFLQGPPK